MVEEMIFISSTKNNSQMKKLIFLSLMAVMLVSCQQPLLMSPDIRMNPYYVVTSVGDTAIVFFVTKSDGKQKVSVADTTIAKAAFSEEPGRILVRGIKEGMTTLKFEVGLTQDFTWGEETCTVEVRPALAD